MNYERGNQIIYAGDIDKKIEEYQNREGDLEDWEQDELSEMLEFRENAQNTIYQWEERTSFILQDYFPNWAAGEADDIYGSEAVGSGYWNMEKYTDDARMRFHEISYGSYTYLADGN